VPTGTFTGEKDSHGREKFTPTWNWRSTTATNKIYIEIFTWPTGGFHLDKLPRKVTSAYLLADKAHKPLKITKSGEGLDIQLPATPLDPIATVLVLNTAS
jgi:alpha-L-fucosidase